MYRLVYLDLYTVPLYSLFLSFMFCYSTIKMHSTMHFLVEIRNKQASLDIFVVHFYYEVSFFL